MKRAKQKQHYLHSYSIAQLCEALSMKRDAYYKYQRRESQANATQEKVIQLVQERRKVQSREGGKKLYKALKEDFQILEFIVVRDKLFDILREKDMLVKQKRSFVKTTNSYHRFHKYKNLIKDLNITRINQVWVSDITYIRLIHGHCYLALITDVFSCKIVGYDISNSLELAGCLRPSKWPCGEPDPILPLYIIQTEVYNIALTNM